MNVFVSCGYEMGTTPITQRAEYHLFILVTRSRPRPYYVNIAEVFCYSNKGGGIQSVIGVVRLDFR